MSDSHPIRDLLPAFSLGILDEDESREVKEHLAGCAACRAEAASFHEVTARLASAAPGRDLPDGLEERVLRAVSQRPPATPSAAPPSARQRRSPWPALTGMAAAVAVALGVGNLLQWNGALGPRTHQPSPRLATAVLSGTENAPQAYGTIVLDPNNEEGVLAVTGLPRLPADRQYQLWLIRDGERRSAGVFSPDAEGYGSMLLTVPADFRNFQSFGISEEPRGGSPAPTGPRVLAGKL